MSRKDTIVVAVLVNAGLLIVLFASALKSEGSDSALVTGQEQSRAEIQEVVAKAEAPVVVGDEVDRALQQFAASQATLAAAPSDAAPTVVAAEVNPFVEDLKAIAVPEPSVQTLVAPVAAKAMEAKQVTVKKGDVLEKIARHHHSSVAEIMRVNHLKNSNLRIGQVLQIPQSKTVSTSEGQVRMYTVKKGDSPWTIAVKNQMKVEDLLRLNNMSETQAKRLKPGDQLRIQ